MKFFSAIFLNLWYQNNFIQSFLFFVKFIEPNGPSESGATTEIWSSTFIFPVSRRLRITSYSPLMAQLPLLSIRESQLSEEEINYDGSISDRTAFPPLRMTSRAMVYRLTFTNCFKGDICSPVFVRATIFRQVFLPMKGMRYQLLIFLPVQALREKS